MTYQLQRAGSDRDGRVGACGDKLQAVPPLQDSDSTLYIMYERLTALDIPRSLYLICVFYLVLTLVLLFDLGRYAPLFFLRMLRTPLAFLRTSNASQGNQHPSAKLCRRCANAVMSSYGLAGSKSRLVQSEEHLNHYDTFVDLKMSTKTCHLCNLLLQSVELHKAREILSQDEELRLKLWQSIENIPLKGRMRFPACFMFELRNNYLERVQICSLQQLCIRFRGKDCSSAFGSLQLFRGDEAIGRPGTIYEDNCKIRSSPKTSRSAN